jgi:hypothetical protein
VTDQHPITPPPELLEQWEAETAHTTKDETWHVAVQAARWGADQELEACCDWLDRNNQWARCDIDELHDARRPKPPSLKEQALRALYAIATGADDTREFHQDIETIKTALDVLSDD